MPTIKGPIHIRKNGDNTELFKKFKEAGVEIKLPFKATGFKSTKLPKGIKIESTELETVRSHIRDVDPTEGVKKKRIRSYKRKKRSR